MVFPSCLGAQRVLLHTAPPASHPALPGAAAGTASGQPRVVVSPRVSKSTQGSLSTPTPGGSSAAAGTSDVPRQEGRVRDLQPIAKGCRSKKNTKTMSHPFLPHVLSSLTQPRAPSHSFSVAFSRASLSRAAGAGGTVHCDAAPQTSPVPQPRTGTPAARLAAVQSGSGAPHAQSQTSAEGLVGPSRARGGVHGWPQNRWLRRLGCFGCYPGCSRVAVQSRSGAPHASHTSTKGLHVVGPPGPRRFSLWRREWSPSWLATQIVIWMFGAF